MLTPNPVDPNALRKRMKIAQSCVFNAATMLEESGDPDNSEALVYAFAELSEILQQAFPELRPIFLD
jgi:hypothetical protein